MPDNKIAQQNSINNFLNTYFNLFVVVFVPEVIWPRHKEVILWLAVCVAEVNIITVLLATPASSTFLRVFLLKINLPAMMPMIKAPAPVIIGIIFGSMNLFV